MVNRKRPIILRCPVTAEERTLGGRVRQPHQMPNTPGNQPATALKIAIGPGCDTQGRRDTLCYTRFFTDHQFAQF